jgi:hypothetical protein
VALLERDLRRELSLFHILSCPAFVPGIHVTPAKAGVQFFSWRVPRYWIPAFAGMTKKTWMAGTLGSSPRAGLALRSKPGHDENQGFEDIVPAQH